MCARDLVGLKGGWQIAREQADLLDVHLMGMAPRLRLMRAMLSLAASA
jgi:hypothetical protein